MQDSVPPLQREELFEGQLWRVRLQRPPGNILDRELIPALLKLVQEAQGAAHLRLVSLEGSADHFSFGASVQEHLPESCEQMLAQMGELLQAVLDSDVSIHAIVHGRCLGGGLELASACHRIYAHPTASFGQPEIRLGVVAPFAAILLPERLRRAEVIDLCLSGRSIDGARAAQLGLVDQLAEDPWSAAVEYLEQHLAPHSASSLRHAVHATQNDLRKRFREQSPLQCEHYLANLMGTRDAKEGLQAFLEKRPPRWTDH